MALHREKLVRNAEKLVSRGKVEAAIREYRKLIAEQPKDTNTLNRLGDLYARLYRIEEAVRLFGQIAAQYTDEGFFVKAIAIFKKIIKLDPTRLNVYEKLAELYHRQGLVNEARTQYQVLADYYVKQDNASSAGAIYQHMVELEPEDPSHRAKLAELYQQQQLLDKAMEQYRAIAGIMLKHGQTDQAEQVLERALDVDTPERDFVSAAAGQLRDAGHAAAARRFLRSAVERDASFQDLLDAEPGGDEEQAPATAPVAVPRAEAPARRVPPPAEVHPPEQVLDSPEELLADDEDLMRALREAEEAVGEAPVGGLDTDADDLVMSWDETESESLVQPPPDMLAQGPEVAGSGFEPDPGRREADTFEIDLGDLDLAATGETGSTAAGPAAAEGELDLDLSFGLDLEAPPEPEAEEAPEAEPEPSVDDFLSEAEVLAKYGLRSKALERVRQVLVTSPDHLGGLRLLIQLQLEDGEVEAAKEIAGRMAALPDAAGSADWLQVQELLGATGDGAAAWEEPARGLAPELAIDLGEGLVDEPDEELPAAGFEDEAYDLGDLESQGAGFEAAEAPPEEAWGEADIAIDHDSVALDDLVEESPPAVVEVVDVDLDDLEYLSEPKEDLGLGPVAGHEATPPPSAFSVGFDLEEEEEVAPPAGETPPPEPPAAEVEPPARRRSARGRAASSEGIDRLLESLLDQGPVTQPRLSRKDREVEELLHAAGRSERARARSAPTVEEAAEAPEVPVADLDQAAGLPPAELAAQPPASEGLEMPEPDAGGPVEVQIGIVPVPAEDLDEEDHSDIEDALAGMKPLGGPVAPAPQATPVAPLDLDDTGTSWLDEVSARREADGTGDAELFEEEEGFFDLGAELEEELSVSDAVGSDQASEQSLEEIVEGFKQGVAEQLSPEAYDTHFDLGIAYREMGLLDEAIGEFQIAAKAPHYLVQCCSMLGICFLEKGLPELAVKWYQRGLAAPGISEEDNLALLYDLAEVYLSSGDDATAHKTFVEVYGINSNFRDIAAKVSQTRPA